MFCCEIRIFELGFVLYELSHANHNHVQALVRMLGVFCHWKSTKPTYLHNNMTLDPEQFWS